MNKKLLLSILFTSLLLPLAGCSKNSFNHEHVWSKYYDNGDLIHVEGNIYMVKNIVHDCIIQIV